MKNYLTRRSELDRLSAEMKNSRYSYEPSWKTTSEFISPNRYRDHTSNARRGGNNYSDIIDPHCTIASRSFSAGLMSYLTSPAKAWFGMKSDIAQLNEKTSVKRYFSEVAEEMRSSFNRSNLYSVLPETYRDLGDFSNGCLYQEDDEETDFLFKSFLLGSYWVGADRNNRIRYFYREFTISVAQIVEKFGEIVDGKAVGDNLSEYVKQCFNMKQFETKIDICHFILPNENYDMTKDDLPRYKKFESTYYEKGFSGSNSNGTSPPASSSNVKSFLRVSGYDYFPVYVSRWSLTGEDVWGVDGPGDMAIRAVKQLQHGERMSMEAINRQVDPHLLAPTTLRKAGMTKVPGGTTFVDIREGMQGVRSLYDVRFDVASLEGKQEQIRNTLSRVYYEDLFLNISRLDSQRTATEIEQRVEEKLLALGPMLIRVNYDVLDPLISNTYQSLEKRGKLPEVPQELMDAGYQVEYTSVLAQAQKVVNIGAIERTLGFVSQAANIDPSVVDKVKLEEFVDDFAEHVGLDPQLINSDKEVEAIRAARAKQQQQQQQLENLSQLSQVGKTLSETNTQDSVLEEIL